ncbi:MAG: hypothetical protein RI991_463 [Bacteroidota bacterium]|jgi:hypothetical protein
MIITELNGGLGNQLFQYAAGLSLALKHQTTLKVSIQFKNNDTSRNLGLSHFNTNIIEANQEEINQFYSSSTLNRSLQALLPPPFKHYFREKHFAYQSGFNKLGPNVYLKGYWQSELYFSSIIDQVKATFTLKPEYYSSVLSLIEEIKTSESVSIHIRKGDYLLHPYSEYYASLESAYYITAIAALQEQHPQLKLFVFTDDPNWVNENLHLASPYRLISGIETSSMYEDFQAMLSCKYHIIANSSFSWWTAWLSAREGKKVIAPKQWFKNGPTDTQDLVPKSWLIV